MYGGAAGGAGGSSGGAAGKAGETIIFDCNTINFTGTIDVTGQNGGAAAANSTGAGGGGGGGAAYLAAINYTANTGTIIDWPGVGGSCTTPSVVIMAPQSQQSSTPRGAKAHITALVGGNPSAITIDAGGVNFNVPPNCSIVGGGGSGAACTCTVAGGVVTACTPSGGNGLYTLTTYTTCGWGGDGSWGTNRVYTITGG